MVSRKQGCQSNSKPLKNAKVGDKWQSSPVIFSLCAFTSESTQKPAGSLTWIPLTMCPSVVTLTKGNHARLNYRGRGKDLSRVMLESIWLTVIKHYLTENVAMEILLGNLREEGGGGGNCISGERNRWLVIKDYFQCPFTANYIFVWGGWERKN